MLNIKYVFQIINNCKSKSVIFYTFEYLISHLIYAIAFIKYFKLIMQNVFINSLIYPFPWKLLDKNHFSENYTLAT